MVFPRRRRVNRRKYWTLEILFLCLAGVLSLCPSRVGVGGWNPPRTPGGVPMTHQRFGGDSATNRKKGSDWGNRHAQSGIELTLCSLQGTGKPDRVTAKEGHQRAGPKPSPGAERRTADGRRGRRAETRTLRRSSRGRRQGESDLVRRPWLLGLRLSQRQPTSPVPRSITLAIALRPNCPESRRRGGLSPSQRRQTARGRQ